MKALNNVNKTNNAQPVADKRLHKLAKLKWDLNVAMSTESNKSKFYTSGEIWAKIRDLEFDIAKDRIHFRLGGNKKYYYADKLTKFAELFEGKTYGGFGEDRTVKAVHFKKYAIEIVWDSTAVSDFKTFDNHKELLNFVDGYVQAVNNHDKEKFFRV